MKNLVIYHGGSCRDGFCAAWIARGLLPTDTEFIPTNYGEDTLPEVTDKHVYLLDFRFKRDVTLAMANRAKRLIILDHHKTAEKELDGIEGENIHCTFDMNKSGGRLTWEHFYGGSGMRSPWLVDYTEDRDLWRWALPNSREINAALRSYPLDFEEWNKLAARDPQDLISEGAAILRAEAAVIDSHVRHAETREFAGHRVKCVNATTLISEIAGELAKGMPFGMSYFVRNDGKWIWSLRSDQNGVDVSEIAKRYGGGGHKHAAGFEGQA